jgi:hypothetical protein
VKIALVAAGAEIGDPEGTREVYAIIALLVVLGIALVMLAVWMWRVTRPDPDLLAPLEVMGERAWRRADPMGQRRRLDEVRPDDAAPLQRPNAPPTLDESFDAGPSAIGVSDLRDYAVLDEPGLPDAADDEVDDEERDDGGADTGEHAEQAVPESDGTPVAPEHPLIDDLDEAGEADLDPDLLAEAAAELEREIGRGDSGP